MMIIAVTLHSFHALSHHILHTLPLSIPSYTPHSPTLYTDSTISLHIIGKGFWIHEDASRRGRRVRYHRYAPRSSHSSLLPSFSYDDYYCNDNNHNMTSLYALSVYTPPHTSTLNNPYPISPLLQPPTYSIPTTPSPFHRSHEDLLPAHHVRLR